MNRIALMVLASLIVASASLVLVGAVAGAERRIALHAVLIDTGAGDREGSGTARITITTRRGSSWSVVCAKLTV